MTTAHLDQTTVITFEPIVRRVYGELCDDIASLNSKRYKREKTAFYAQSDTSLMTAILDTGRLQQHEQQLLQALCERHTFMRVVRFLAKRIPL